MVISANLLYPGYKLLVGKKQYEVLEVHFSSGLTRVVYKNAKGVMRSKSYKSNDMVKIV